MAIFHQIRRGTEKPRTEKPVAKKKVIQTLKKQIDHVDPAKASKDRKRGRPASGNPRTLISFRVDQTLAETMKGSGKGWQTRAEAALRREFKA